MVKVSIRDYMPPYTTWMQVELEEELCGSATVMSDDPNTIEEHKFGAYGKETGITADYQINQSTWDIQQDTN